MKQHVLLLVILVLGLVLAGCTQSEQQPIKVQLEQPKVQYLCDDGKTIVSTQADCPKIDLEYLECIKASRVSSYYASSERDVCFYNLAVVRNNVSLCRYVDASYASADYSPAKCAEEIAMAINDPEICNEIGSQKFDCFNDLADKYQDPALCNRIVIQNKKDECLDNYVYANYETITDWDVCTSINGVTSKDSCYYYAAIGTYNVTYCDKIAIGGYYQTKTDCYVKIAQQRNDYTLCKGLGVGPERNACYYKYAYNKYDNHACTYISDDALKDKCKNYTYVYSYY